MSSIRSSASPQARSSARALQMRLALPLIAAGAAVSAAAWWSDPRLLAFSWLLGFSFVWVVALGALFYVALHHLTRAVWSVVYLRLIELLAALAPLAAIAFLPLLAWGEWIYPWLDSGALKADPVLAHKAAYLNWPFFVTRAAIYFTVWIVFALCFLRLSALRSAAPSPELESGALPAPTARLRRLSAPFMLLFALTVTFASIDWLMSLTPGWYSTIFGVYVFAGMAVSALAALVLLALWLAQRGAGPLEMADGSHLYNLGALMFAFSCFWGYVAMSQYLLIWAANLPEETLWYAVRQRGAWPAVGVALIVTRFAGSFALLLSRRGKTCRRTLTFTSLLVLAGQLVDLHWIIMPQALMPADASHAGADALHAAGALRAFCWHEIGPVLLMIGMSLAWVSWLMRRYGTAAESDPHFDDSRRFRLQ